MRLLLGGSVQLITIASISFERYQALYRPFDKHYRIIRIQISIIASWIVGLLCMIMDWTLFQESPTHLLCIISSAESFYKNLSYELGIYIFVPLTFLSVCFILIFYGSILYLVQKHVRTTQSTLGGLIKKSNRVHPVNDSIQNILVNNYMPSDIIIVENDAKASTSLELKESSSNSKTKGKNLSVMDAYKTEGDSTKHSSKQRQKKLLIKKKSSSVKNISKNVSFLPPLQRKSNFGAVKSTIIPAKSQSTKTVENKNFDCHANLLSASLLATQGAMMPKLKHEEKETITLEMDLGKGTSSKSSSIKRCSSAPDMSENKSQTCSIKSCHAQQVENAQLSNTKPLLYESVLICEHFNQAICAKQKEPPGLISSVDKLDVPSIYKSPISQHSSVNKEMFTSQGQKHIRNPENFPQGSHSYKFTSLSLPVETVTNNDIPNETGKESPRETGYIDTITAVDDVKHRTDCNVDKLEPSLPTTHKSYGKFNEVSTDDATFVKNQLPQSENNNHNNVSLGNSERTTSNIRQSPLKDPKSKKKEQSSHNTSKSKKDSVSSVVQIHDADGLTTKARTTRTTITGDICVMNTSNKIKGKRKIEAKSAKRTAVVLVTFLIAWLPFPIVIMVLWMFNTRYASHAKALLSSYLISLTLSLLAASVNPLVYGVINKQFHKEFKRLIKKCRQNCKKK